MAARAGARERGTADHQPTIAIRTVLRLFGREVPLSFVVPAGPVGWLDLLPRLQELADAMAKAGAERAERERRPVTCRKGCGACCSQLVPIAEVEAHHLRRLVERLPPERQARVRSRFDDARRRLGAAGLWPRLVDPRGIPREEYESASLDYFALGVPCPFLEDGACSIHADRPLRCREYLVTSPADDCSSPGSGTVRGVELPANVTGALNRAGRRDTRSGWLPLVAALEWTDAHELLQEPRAGGDLLREIIEVMTGEKVGGERAPR